MNPSSHAPEEDLSVREAAERYGVPVRTMAQRLRLGEIQGAYKIRGPRGQEWRVPAAALEAFGYTGAAGGVAPGVPEDREIAALKKAVAAERRRAEDAYRRLEHALLECGPVRARLEEEHNVRRQAEALAGNRAAHPSAFHVGDRGSDQ